MHSSRTVVSAALSLALCGGVALAPSATAAPQAAGTAQGQPLSLAQIEAAITKAGYTGIHKLKLHHGVWKAKVLGAKGQRVKLSVDRFTGEVYPSDVQPKLSASDVQARLAAAGYQRVHDVKFDDGLWKADAFDKSGQKVDVRMAPDDGRILDVHPDH